MAHKTTTQEELYRSKTLYMAFELSKKSWRVLSSAGGIRKFSATMTPGDTAALREIVTRARRKFELAEDSRVLSCIEAGRDGFWPHRFLLQNGIESLVIDAASMKVSRHRRRAKTDRIDAQQLLADLVRFDQGDKDVWRVVHAPTAEDEDHRHFHRELEQLKKERTQHRNRLRSILATEGVKIPGNLMKALTNLDSLKNWNGDALSKAMLWRLERKVQRLVFVEKQIREIQQHQVQCVKNPATPKLEKITKLNTLRGIGVTSSWILVMESLGWKKFRNRKEVGGSVGLGGTPYNSGQLDREQGISKAGNARVRATLVELAWMWMRYQPNSDITKWFEKRYAGQNKRMRRIGLVAVARRLMIELWHFLEHDVDPPGAIINKNPA